MLDIRKNEEQEQKQALFLSTRYSLDSLEKQLAKVLKDRNKYINEPPLGATTPRSQDWVYKANILELAIKMRKKCKK